MNRIFTILISAFLCVGLNAQTVNKPVIFKKTATWCPHCGNWGWSFMENLMSEFSDNSAIVVGLHYSGDLQNPVAQAINGNFPTSGQPVFMFNGSDQNVSSSNSTDKLESLKSMTSDFNNFDPEFEIDLLSWRLADVTGVLEAEVTLTPNITDANMDYYLGLYLLENELLRNQSGSVTDNIHPRVLQGSFTDQAFGLLAYESGSSLSPTDVFMASETLDMSNLQITNGALDGKLDALAVVWSYDGSKYEVVQAEIANVDFEVATEEIEWASDVKLYVDDNQNLNFAVNSKEGMDEIKISIFDISGKMVHSENINVEGTFINYSKSMVEYNDGNYILHIQNKSEIWSDQFSKF